MRAGKLGLLQRGWTLVRTSEDHPASTEKSQGPPRGRSSKRCGTLKQEQPESRQPKHILQALASLDRGGTETVVMEWYRSLDRDRFQFDFVVNTRDEPYQFEADISALGGRVFRIPRATPFNFLGYAWNWYRLLRDHPEWLLLHVHHIAPAPVYLAVAKSLGRTTWTHSHSAPTERTLTGLFKAVSFRFLSPLSDRLFACSTLAAQITYGRACQRAVVLPNPINVERFRYDPDARLRIREEAGISRDSFVVGHVGRFVELKNHSFLVQAFAALAQRRPEAMLMLVGDGALKDSISREAQMLGLQERVVFLGTRTDVGACLSAMDLFLLLSQFEGFPVSLIEAQASGLRCVVSDTVTTEAALLDEVLFLPLSDGPSGWAARMNSESPTTTREMAADRVKAAGYDAVAATARLSDMYSEELGLP